MKPEQIIREVNKMDLSERLILVENIWDSIAASTEIPLSEGQKQELDRRYAEFQEGSSPLHSCNLTHSELRKKYQ